MNLIQEAFRQLFPNKEFFYQTEIEYNRRLSNFNANIKLEQKKISVHMNLKWKNIDAEIKIGLIQHLLLKIFNQKKTTQNIDIYNNFVKNIDILTPKTNADPPLEASFNRVNKNFFSNQIEQPNLGWGQNAFRKLASYNFHSDTIVVSKIFKEAEEEILDYLIYHELLHKQFKFKFKNGRSSFHSREFREAEKTYPNYNEIEKKLNQITKKMRKNKLQQTGLWKFFK